ncbi:MAG: hypothetical protein GWO19_04260 [Nitrospinaceae bacterium]|nr:hypothetical protein [Nitrospinaceae bacterium]
MYLDRVIEPEALARLRHVPRKTDLSPLGCPECGQRIGMPTEHGPGNRLAWRLIPGAFRKKIEP